MNTPVRITTSKTSESAKRENARKTESKRRIKKYSQYRQAERRIGNIERQAPKTYRRARGSGRAFANYSWHWKGAYHDGDGNTQTQVLWAGCPPTLVHPSLLPRARIRGNGPRRSCSRQMSLRRRVLFRVILFLHVDLRAVSDPLKPPASLLCCAAPPFGLDAEPLQASLDAPHSDFLLVKGLARACDRTPEHHPPRHTLLSYACDKAREFYPSCAHHCFIVTRRDERSTVVQSLAASS